MSAADMVITLDVRIHDDQIETGLWCDNCALPSAIGVPVTTYWLKPSGVSIFGRGHVTGCPDCGWRTTRGAI